MSVTLYAVISTFIVSLISFIGVLTLFFQEKKINKFIIFLVSLAAGSLIGDVFFHIVPELYKEGAEGINYSIFIISGILFFFVLENLLHWRHCHKDDCDCNKHPVAINNLVADGIHNFVDGLILGVSYQTSIEVGLATTLAVILHEIPQEMGDFGIFIHAGINRLKALFFNFLSGALAILGVIISLIIGEISEDISFVLLSFAAGGFIYIAMADLIPEIKHADNIKSNLVHIFFIGVGISLMYCFSFIEAGH